MHNKYVISKTEKIISNEKFITYHLNKDTIEDFFQEIHKCFNIDLKHKIPVAFFCVKSSTIEHFYKTSEDDFSITAYMAEIYSEDDGQYEDENGCLYYKVKYIVDKINIEIDEEYDENGKIINNDCNLVLLCEDDERLLFEINNVEDIKEFLAQDNGEIIKLNIDKDELISAI